MITHNKVAEAKCYANKENRTEKEEVQLIKLFRMLEYTGSPTVLFKRIMHLKEYYPEQYKYALSAAIDYFKEKPQING